MIKRTKRISFIIYEGYELLDLAGPASVFNCAAYLGRDCAYKISVLSLNGGTISSSSGVKTDSVSFGDTRIENSDTVLIVGAVPEVMERMRSDSHFLEQAEKLLRCAGRAGSICSGAFLLAEMGILSERAATTHWAGFRKFERSFANTTLRKNALFVKDGNVWTSAGVSTGIDMSLEMVREDYGISLMSAVAERLVLQSRRTAEQSQFSKVLELQHKSDSGFGDLIVWIEDRLHLGISVDQMAEFCKMSPRSFHRKFEKQFGQSPSKYLEDIKMKKASEFLSMGLQVAQVSRAVGYSSEAAFRSRFRSYFSVTPLQYRAAQKKD